MRVSRPCSLSLPHAVDRFLERCTGIIRNRDRDGAERFLRGLMSKMEPVDGTWDPHALDGLGQGFWECEHEGFVISATVDGNGMLRTVNSCEEI